MLFHTLSFLIFFSVTVAAILVARRHRAQKAVLLLASAVFYMWWNPAFILLIVVSASIDYVVALRLDTTEDPRPRKVLLATSLVTNLGLLAIFKYAHFFEDNLLLAFRALGYRPNWADVNVVLPIGISFYTFNTLSYTIDVYRRRVGVCRSALDYAVFVTFFPHLVAGPIVRASDFLHQLERPARITFDRPALFLFLRGLAKKVIVADGVGLFADAIFNAPTGWSSPVIWLATISFYVQIYCDFSGYTDMAIAIARILGYKLPDNFDRPYLSGSPAEFWRRWHMSLSKWFRDYLYIPLGGNRRGTVVTARNLMLTMLIAGLWHGASWNFVLWGGLHGVALIVHRAWDRLTRNWASIWRQLGWYRLATIALMQYWVLLTWIPFRVPGTQNMLYVLRKFVVFDADVHLADLGLGALSPFSTVFLLAAFFAIHVWSGRRGGLDQRLGQAAPAVRALVCVAIGVVLFLLWPTAEAPFIYFQF